MALCKTSSSDRGRRPPGSIDLRRRFGRLPESNADLESAVWRPLRDDQIDDVVNFVFNWKAQAEAGRLCRSTLRRSAPIRLRRCRQVMPRVAQISSAKK